MNVEEIKCAGYEKSSKTYRFSRRKKNGRLYNEGTNYNSVNYFGSKLNETVDIRQNPYKAVIS